MKTSEEERLIIKYLLGDLVEPERTKFEERYVADKVLFEAVVAAENDLIDAFVRGELPQADVGPFEKRYLGSPQGRERVAFARALQEHVSEAAKVLVAGQLAGERSVDPQWAQAALAPEPPSATRAVHSSPSSRQPPIWSAVSAFLRGPLPALQLGLATATIVLVAFSWLAIQNRRLRRDLQHVTAAEVALRAGQEAASKRKPIEPTVAAQEVGDKEGVAEGVEAKRAPTLPAVATLVLVPGLYRGVGAVSQKQLVIRPSTSYARLHLELERDDYPSYRASIENPDTGELWEKKDLKSETGRGAVKQITVQPPTDFLQGGDYIVQLAGTAPDGTVHDVESYSFRVVRR